MKLTLTREEMLERRRLAGGFEPLRADCTVEDTAGTDIDRLLEQQLRHRYLELLDTGDPELLAPVEIGGEADVAPFCEGGSEICLPPECRRALAVRLEGWCRAARVLPADEFGRVMVLQRNPFTAADSSAPVAVALSGGRIAAWPGSGRPVSLSAVCDYGPEKYLIDERALDVLCRSEYNPLL